MRIIYSTPKQQNISRYHHVNLKFDYFLIKLDIQMSITDLQYNKIIYAKELFS